MGNRRHFAVIVLIAALTVAGTSWRRALAASPAAHPLVAPDTLIETGLYEAGRPGVVDPQSVVLAAVPAVERRRQQAPVDFPAGGLGDRRERRLRVELPGGHQGLEGVRVRRPEGRDALPLEDRATEWVFASYVWNAEGTSATMAPDEGLPRVAEIAPGKSHSIPSVTECRACHVSNRTEVLGFNALQLSTDRDPNAIHGEPLEAGHDHAGDAGRTTDA